MVRPRFDIARPLVAARSFTYNGENYAAGDPFKSDGIAPFKLNTLYGSRAVNHAEGEAASVDPVQLSQTRPGYFEITAPWFDEPIKVRGKAKAEEALAELREAGEPDDYRGVEIEGGDGGWYLVTPEWGDTEKIQGKDAAYARATELRAEGPAPEHYALVTVEQKDGEGDVYLVSAPWLSTEEVTGEDAAKDRANVIRKAGPPEGFDFEKAAEEAKARRIADEEAATKAKDEADAASRRAAYSDAVVISTSTVDDVTTYSLTAPGIETPETFDAEDAAIARQTALREAGPPEGFVPASE